MPGICCSTGPTTASTYAERDALDAAAWRRLAVRGLLDDQGAPAPALADALGVLAAPAWEVDARVLVPGATVHGVVAAARGSLALVAEREPGGGVRLSPADPGDLAGALLAHLPDRRAVAGVPIVVPRHALATGGSAADRARRLRRAGVGRHLVERFGAIAETPPERVLQCGVAVRDADGRRCRGPRVVTVIDTPQGRCVVGPDPSGARLEYRPTDRPRLRTELAGLLERHRRQVVPGAC